MNLIAKVKGMLSAGLIGLVACTTNPTLPTQDVVNRYMSLGFSRDESIVLYDRGISIEDAKRYADLNSKYNSKVDLRAYEIRRLLEEGIPFETVASVTSKTAGDEGLPK
mgnify:CR=1 FL=1